MSTLTCVDVEIALPALALDALEQGEHAAVLEHVEGCPGCKILLAQYHDVTDLLAVGVRQRQPPPSLKKALLQRVQPRRVRWLERMALWLYGTQLIRRWTIGAALTVGFAIVGLLGYGMLHLTEQQAVMAAKLSSQQRALALLTGGTTSQISMVGTQVASGASAVMRYDPQKTLAVVQVRNLPALPQGKVYQLWLIDASGRHDSGAVFSIPSSADDNTVLVITAPRPMREYANCGVSIEPSGGSKQPTGPTVLTGELWS